MKFGTILASRCKEDWRCIAYDSLKQHIKSTDCSEVSVRSFHDMLADEIEQVDSFFQKMRADLDNVRTKRGSRMSPAKLRQHAVLNYLAVLKILKKHSKIMHRSSEDSAGESDFAVEALAATKQRLFSSSFFTALNTGTDLFTQDDNQAGSTRPSVTFEQCPICLTDTLDFAELPCGHSFCWACLANCAAHSMSTCPLCRKEQSSLEPVNLQIEKILGCLAHNYWPANQPEVSDSSRPVSPAPGCSDEDPSGSPLCSPRSAESFLSPRVREGGHFFSPRSAGPFGSTQPGSSRRPRLGGLTRTPSPATPCISPRRSPSPPSLRRAPPEPLLKALRMNSEDKVRAALAKEPGAAQELFYDNGFEPPLCAALRLGCSVAIIRLLVDAGADVHATTVMGHSPLHLLSSGLRPRLFDAPPEDFDDFDPLAPGGISSAWTKRVVQYETNVANALLAAHADPEGEMHTKGAGSNCFELARQAGKDHLVQLYLKSRMPMVA